jgi:hypothetical protein
VDPMMLLKEKPIRFSNSVFWSKGLHKPLFLGRAAGNNGGNDKCPGCNNGDVIWWLK